MNTSIVKVSYAGDTRRIRVAVDAMTWESLVCLIKATFKLHDPVRITYVDDEADTVTVSTDSEVMEAFHVSRSDGRLYLRFTVTREYAVTCSTTSTGAESDVQHLNVSCDGCGQMHIRGHRYKCAVCKDFDYCESCEALGGHDDTHPFLKIRDPSLSPAAIMIVLNDFQRAEGEISGGVCVFDGKHASKNKKEFKKERKKKKTKKDVGKKSSNSKRKINKPSKGKEVFDILKPSMEEEEAGKDAKGTQAKHLDGSGSQSVDTGSEDFNTDIQFLGGKRKQTESDLPQLPTAHTATLQLPALVSLPAPHLEWDEEGAPPSYSTVVNSTDEVAPVTVGTEEAAVVAVESFVVCPRCTLRQKVAANCVLCLAEMPKLQSSRRDTCSVVTENIKGGKGHPGATSLMTSSENVTAVAKEAGDAATIVGALEQGSTDRAAAQGAAEEVAKVVAVAAARSSPVQLQLETLRGMGFCQPEEHLIRVLLKSGGDIRRSIVSLL